MTSETNHCEREAIRGTVQNYADGYIHKNVELLRQTFSEGAKLISVEDGKILEVKCSEWFLQLEERKKSGVAPISAKTEIIAIHQTGTAATASVRLTFPTFSFTDYLSLLKTNLGWRIAGKIYDFKMLKAIG